MELLLVSGVARNEESHQHEAINLATESETWGTSDYNHEAMHSQCKVGDGVEYYWETKHNWIGADGADRVAIQDEFAWSMIEICITPVVERIL